ncbi:MAG: hypothetical protein FGM61_04610 [Sediminibacterium sp.]|nr:hypothetical protein [Sediminibacterium sp.]
MRKCLLLLVACCCLQNVFNKCYSQANIDQHPISDAAIIERINQFRPLRNAQLPKQIHQQLGATHVAGKYFFSEEPYLIEGCKALYKLGFGVIKLWFRKDGGGYPYHSNWQISQNISLTELAQHPYWKAAFEVPFTTFALSVDGAGVNTTDLSAAAEENELYELCCYLLQNYHNRKVNFIIHNWEGDWIMRGGTGNAARWSRKPGEKIDAVDGVRYSVGVPADSAARISTMIKWFQCRQKAVSRAREQFPNAKCKIYHAIEANKVKDSREGIPGIVNRVLPEVETDMVSWSCYDGMDSTGLSLYKGIQYIQQQMRPTAYMKGKKEVFLGEIGIPEQRYAGLMEKDPVINRWDAYMGVMLALKIPYLIQWELYCNEPKDESLRKLNDTRKKDEMRGFWLIRPDSTLSFAGTYFTNLLQKASASK